MYFYFVSRETTLVEEELEGRKLDGYGCRCVLNTMCSGTKLSNNIDKSRCWRDGSVVKNTC